MEFSKIVPFPKQKTLWSWVSGAQGMPYQPGPYVPMPTKQKEMTHRQKRGYMKII